VPHAVLVLVTYFPLPNAIVKAFSVSSRVFSASSSSSNAHGMQDA
jgi:hypothetical protein